MQRPQLEVQANGSASNSRVNDGKDKAGPYITVGRAD
jgi:hypothetical protein